jgi:hypothetical protein
VSGAVVGSFTRLQWNSKGGDMFSPRPAYFMGTSPPSGHAVVVTENTGRGGPPLPLAAPGPWAITMAADDNTMIAESRLRCIVFICIFSSK